MVSGKRQLHRQGTWEPCRQSPSRVPGVLITREETTQGL